MKLYRDIMISAEEPPINVGWLLPTQNNLNLKFFNNGQWLNIFPEKEYTLLVEDKPDSFTIFTNIGNIAFTLPFKFSVNHDGEFLIASEHNAECAIGNNTFLHQDIIIGTGVRIGKGVSIPDGIEIEGSGPEYSHPVSTILMDYLPMGTSSYRSSSSTIGTNSPNINAVLVGRGTYKFRGVRDSNVSDGLPIQNFGDNHLLDCKLEVLSTPLDHSMAQVLTLLNSSGGPSCNVYVRAGKHDETSAQSIVKQPWGKLQTNIELGVVDEFKQLIDSSGVVTNNEALGLDNIIDNGIYSGVYLLALDLAEVFTMLVINNYPVAHELKSITLIKLALQADGSFKFARRTRMPLSTTWTAWEDVSQKLTPLLQTNGSERNYIWSSGGTSSSATVMNVGYTGIDRGYDGELVFRKGIWNSVGLDSYVETPIPTADYSYDGLMSHFDKLQFDIMLDTIGTALHVTYPRDRSIKFKPHSSDVGFYVDLGTTIALGRRDTMIAIGTSPEPSFVSYIGPEAIIDTRIKILLSEFLVTESHYIPCINIGTVNNFSDGGIFASNGLQFSSPNDLITIDFAGLLLDGINDYIPIYINNTKYLINLVKAE